MMTREDKVTQIIAHLVMIFMSVCALIPFILLVIASFTDNMTAIRDGYTFFPKKWSLEAYRFIAREWEMLGRAYGITIIVTVIGTICSLFMTSTLAYALAKDGLPGRSFLMIFVIFTMLFNGGLVPTYYIYTNVFNIKNTLAALIVPGLLMNAFNIVLVRNYFRTNIPSAITEAATIDGAGEFRIFFTIVMPLSLPILATVGLLIAIMYWNDWRNGMYYLTDPKLFSIQNILNKINENVRFIADNASKLGGTIDTSNIPSTTIRMAIAVVGILPIVFGYPFFQKYFVKGITIGSVKG